MSHDVNDTLTAVAGLTVGHATLPEGPTGCTVVIGPFRAAAHVAGMATGTRELDVLRPEHLVPTADAILLTGGSAFGLAAADGVAAWLSARGRGFDTGVARVPIVPAAVIFDLREGGPRPGPGEGRAACDAARGDPVSEGRVGAGAGATVGKAAGRERASPGGIGSAAERVREWTVGALAVVNALGDVLDDRGRVVAGARGPDGGWLDSSRLLVEARAEVGGRETPSGGNTTLAVVATDAPLSRVDLGRVARMAATALARRISPVATPFDGDVVFAVSTAPDERPLPLLDITALGVAARDALERAITRAVTVNA